MQKCPSCFEDLKEIPKDDKCPFCHLMMGGKVVHLDYPSVNRKKCFFCGELVASEAIYCRFCKKWLDDVAKMMDRFDNL